jgi:hypothetical protein
LTRCRTTARCRRRRAPPRAAPRPPHARAAAQRNEGGWRYELREAADGASLALSLHVGRHLPAEELEVDVQPLLATTAVVGGAARGGGGGGGTTDIASEHAVVAAGGDAAWSLPQPVASAVSQLLGCQLLPLGGNGPCVGLGRVGGADARHGMRAQELLGASAHAYSARSQHVAVYLQATLRQLELIPGLRPRALLVAAADGVDDAAVATTTPAVAGSGLVGSGAPTAPQSGAMRQRRGAVPEGDAEGDIDSSSSERVSPPPAPPSLVALLRRHPALAGALGVFPVTPPQLCGALATMLPPAWRGATLVPWVPPLSTAAATTVPHGASPAAPPSEAWVRSLWAEVPFSDVAAVESLGDWPLVPLLPVSARLVVSDVDEDEEDEEDEEEAAAVASEGASAHAGRRAPAAVPLVRRLLACSAVAHARPSCTPLSGSNTCLAASATRARSACTTAG